MTGALILLDELLVADLVDEVLTWLRRPKGAMTMEMEKFVERMESNMTEAAQSSHEIEGKGNDV